MYDSEVSDSGKQRLAFIDKFPANLEQVQWLSCHWECITSCQILSNDREFLTSNQVWIINYCGAC